jgi:hypothetical protein
MSVEILDMYVTEDGAELNLEYLTTRELMDEHEAVQREVEQMWEAFLEEEAEAQGVRIVRVEVLEKVETIPVLGMNFKLTKQAEGWRKEGGFAFPPKN